MLVPPLAAVAGRVLAVAPNRAAERAAVVPLLAALLAGESLTQAQRRAVVLEVLRGWRAVASAE